MSRMTVCYSVFYITSLFFCYLVLFDTFRDVGKTVCYSGFIMCFR